MSLEDSRDQGGSRAGPFSRNGAGIDEGMSEGMHQPELNAQSEIGGEPEAVEVPREEDKRKVVESLLFVSPEPLSVGLIADLTGIEPGAVREIINQISDCYGAGKGGFALREVAGGFSFYAVPEVAPYLSRLIRSQVNPRLTRAALETIAIVAYLQPVSRGLIAEIRGVRSEGVIKTLEERGMVEAVGRGGPPGYPTLYATTIRFLERFGLNSLEDLPDLEQFAPDRETVEKIKQSLSWELVEEETGAGSEQARKNSKDTVGGADSIPQDGGKADSRGAGDQERR